LTYELQRINYKKLSPCSRKIPFDDTFPSKPWEERFFNGKASKAILRRLVFHEKLRQRSRLSTHHAGDAICFYRMTKSVRTGTEILGHLINLYAFLAIGRQLHVRYRIYAVAANIVFQEWRSRWRSVQVIILN